MNFTEAQITQFKKQHPEGVHILDVVIDEEKNEIVQCALKHPTLDIILAAGEVHDSPIKQGLMIMDNIWIEGDPRIKLNEEAKAAVAIVAAGLFKAKLVTVKKA